MAAKAKSGLTAAEEAGKTEFKEALEAFEGSPPVCRTPSPPVSELTPLQLLRSRRKRTLRGVSCRQSRLLAALAPGTPAVQ